LRYTANLAPAFEDFLGGDFGIALEERRVVQNRGNVLGNLENSQRIIKQTTKINLAYLAHALIAFNEDVNCFYCQETRIHIRIFAIRIQYVWSDDGGKVVNVHLATRFGIDRVERGDPIQEGE